MLFRLVLIGLLFFAGCGSEFCKHRMEIIPGMYWEYHAPLLEYHAPRHSRIVSDKHGIIVEGEVNQVHMTFYEFGFDVSGLGKCGEGKCVYVDLLRNVLDENEGKLAALQSHNSFGSFDVTSAMGMYVKASRQEYLAAMKALKERVAKKLTQDEVGNLK